MAEKSCVICGGDENEGPLVQAPCGTHWVCHDDVSSFFERATDNESLFPPKCCGQLFMLQDYEQYVGFDKAWAYQVKEQGEYAVLAKFRIYCGNGACAKFLHPSSHVTDEATKITYAICEDATCGEMTCTGCRTLLNNGTQNHVCTKNEDEEKFKKIAMENGYQECAVCGATVELIEACNHITCDCGHDFCYICGIDWEGLHGCPHYGKPEYDAEGYNQDGFHHTTGLNRDSLTRRQDIARRRGEDPDAEDDEDGEEEDIDWEVLQHLTPNQRIMIHNLENAAREDALDQLRIELFEEQGIMFGQDAEDHAQPPRFQPHPLIQQLLQQTLATFVARAPADEDGGSELIQDSIAEIASPVAVFALSTLDPAFNATENPVLSPEHIQTLAEHFTRDREIVALEMDPEVLERLGEELAQQFIRRATHPDNGPAGASEDAAERYADADIEQDANLHGEVYPTQVDEFLRAATEHRENNTATQQDANVGTGPGRFTEQQIEGFLQQLTRADLTVPHGDFPGRDYSGTATAALLGGEAAHAGSAQTPPTEPEETDPSTPEDGVMPEWEAKGPVEGAGRLWGPPGGWPEEDEEL